MLKKFQKLNEKEFLDIVSATCIKQLHRYALLLDVLDGNMVKMEAAYNNEVGYSNRLIDLVDYIDKKGI